MRDESYEDGWTWIRNTLFHCEWIHKVMGRRFPRQQTKTEKIRADTKARARAHHRDRKLRSLGVNQQNTYFLLCGIQARPYGSESTLTGKDVGISVLFLVVVLIGLLVSSVDMTARQGLQHQSETKAPVSLLFPHDLASYKKTGTLTFYRSPSVHCIPCGALFNLDIGTSSATYGKQTSIKSGELQLPLSVLTNCLNKITLLWVQTNTES